MQEILNYTVFDIRILDLSIAIIILMLSFLLRQVISKIIIKTLKELTAKTKTTLDDTIVEVLEEPLKLSSVVFGFFLAKEWLHIETFDGFLSSVVKSFALFILFWILYRLIDNFEIFFMFFAK